jgi:hypothetical protein
MDWSAKTFRRGENMKHGLYGIATGLALCCVTSDGFAADEAWTITGLWGDGPWVFAGDFTGDSRTDVCSASAYYCYQRTSNGINAFNFAYRCVGFLWGHQDWGFSGDFNGDGYDDIASINGATAVIRPGGSGGVGVAPPLGSNCSPYDYTPLSQSINSSWGSDHRFAFAGDFNGDGYDDIASGSGANVYVKFGAPSFAFSSATWPVTNQWGSADYTYAGDFNGDGRQDIASISGGTAYMKLSTGSGMTSAVWSIPNSWGAGNYVFAGDFDGDGYDDIVSFSGSTAYRKFSTGSGFYDAGNVSVNASWGNAWYTHVGDYDWDYDADVMSASGGTAYMKFIHD